MKKKRKTSDRKISLPHDDDQFFNNTYLNHETDQIIGALMIVMNLIYYQKLLDDALQNCTSSLRVLLTYDDSMSAYLYASLFMSLM